ncbi:MAG: aspartate-semialdehyde dehydrogenase [Pyrinomonadaceae bacterium]|nr:aspartate-semialdehyde dehydrogenase [Pyrinomonadaceae bacterium]
MEKKYRVGILGATGTVGQRFVQLLENHPNFEVTALAASDRSIGKSYVEATNWKQIAPMPENVKNIKVQAIEPDKISPDCDIVFASLPSDIAKEAEFEFAKAGFPVISNSSAYRMESDVPLIIPEINAEHLALIETQRRNRNFDKGFIVTNPNCAAMVADIPLYALHKVFGIESVIVTTLQAVSGAGYPGVPSLDIVDNIVPYIANEEEKFESETLKILGAFDKDVIRNANFKISAQCTRVNVIDGHTACIRVKLKSKASLEDVKNALKTFESLPQELKLHSAPNPAIIVREEPDRPQPRLDRDTGNGMTTTIGRILPDSVFDYKFVALSHNVIRGAAGAAVLNAELLIAKGLI